MRAVDHLFQELSSDQHRELVNSEQRLAQWADARRRQEKYRGSMLFVERGGVETLIRDYYDPRSGVKRQKSLGPRSPETDAILARFKAGREEAASRLKASNEALLRQTAINRALRLGRVPETGAKILRALDRAGILGQGLRVVGTNALFAYEAACGVHLSSSVTTTEDIDILIDSRSKLDLLVEDETAERTFLGLLRRVDRSFVVMPRAFQASNAHGYSVDLVQPMRNPPWRADRPPEESEDLMPVDIAGLVWHENSPAFESVAIDVRGAPVKIVAPDPRAFAIHKLWLSRRPDRSPLKRRRDEEQARVVGRLVAHFLRHLPFEAREFRSFPKGIVEDAAKLFTPVTDLQ